MSKKVVVIGSGMVGATYAYAMVNQQVVDEVVLVDLNEDLAKAHARDISDGRVFLGSQTQIRAGGYEECHDADLVCITAGAPQKPGQTRLDLAKVNAKITKSIVTEVMKSGFDGILLMAINPVDVMTYVAQKVSKLPPQRVLGSGTSLDTARLRDNLAKYFNVNPRSIHATIIGEHGDSSVPLWSHASIGPMPILDFVKLNSDKYSFEGLENCYEEAKNAAYEIIKYKNSTYFGIGLSLTSITRDILSDQNRTLSITAMLNGQFGHDDVYISVPAIIGKDGVERILRIVLTKNEQEKLDESIAEIKRAIDLVKEEGII